MNPRVKFKYQVQLIKKALTLKTVFYWVILTWITVKKQDVNYAHKNLFSDSDEELSSCDLIQMIEFDTWSRIVGNELKVSILDHVYIKRSQKYNTSIW